MLCKCQKWARTNGFLTKHHPLCAHYDPEGDARELIAPLLKAMREWGSEEDGIPDFAADAYDRAAIAVGEMPCHDPGNHNRG